MRCCLYRIQGIAQNVTFQNETRMVKFTKLSTKIIRKSVIEDLENGSKSIKFSEKSSRTIDELGTCDLHVLENKENRLQVLLETCTRKLVFTLVKVAELSSLLIHFLLVFRQIVDHPLSSHPFLLNFGPSDLHNVKTFFFSIFFVSGVGFLCTIILMILGFTTSTVFTTC